MIVLLILRWLFLHARLGTALLEEFLPSFGGWPLYAILAVLSLYGYAHHKGELACKADQRAAEIRLEQRYAQVQKHTQGLSDKQLDKRLRRFQRD